MAKNKVDGIIESVRYTPDGQVDWVRAHLRNGKIYTDWVILERDKLIQEIKAGKEFQTGKRLPYMGGMFELKAAVKVIQENGKDILVVGDKQASHDHLEDVPVI